jgi:hypothetical protein
MGARLEPIVLVDYVTYEDNLYTRAFILAKHNNQPECGADADPTTPDGSFRNPKLAMSSRAISPLHK